MTFQRTIAIDARVINSSTGRYVERLLTYLEKIDTETHYYVLVREKDKDYWKPTNKNFEVRVADFDNYSFAEQTRFLKFLHELNADLVHFSMPQQPLLYFKPHVTTVHDLTLLKTYNSDKSWLSYHVKQLIGYVVFFLIARTSQHIITPSKFTKQEYVAFARIPENRVTVTYESADTNSFKPEPFTLPFQKYLLYVGTQSDYKNIQGLIQAHQRLKAKHPDLGLVLAGSKSEATKRNEAWVKEHGFRDVIFTGFVSNEQLTWLFQHCATYVFPSFMEGFGLPGLEAMACGAPVVSSNATCLPEVYGDAAHYCNPHSVADIARAIEEVITDETLRKSLIKRGSKQIKRYSWQEMAKQTHEIYMRHSPVKKS